MTVLLKDALAPNLVQTLERRARSPAARSPPAPAAPLRSTWRAAAPRGFTFAVKASRFLSHMKKLKDPEEPLDLFFSRETGDART